MVSDYKSAAFIYLSWHPFLSSCVWLVHVKSLKLTRVFHVCPSSLQSRNKWCWRNWVAGLIAFSGIDGVTDSPTESGLVCFADSCSTIGVNGNVLWKYVNQPLDSSVSSLPGIGDQNYNRNRIRVRSAWLIKLQLKRICGDWQTLNWRCSTSIGDPVILPPPPPPPRRQPTCPPNFFHNTCYETAEKTGEHGKYGVDFLDVTGTNHTRDE